MSLDNWGAKGVYAPIEWCENYISAPRNASKKVEAGLHMKNVETNQGTADLERQTYTVEEARKRLGIGRTVAYRKGLLPTIKVAGRLLVPRQALERMLAGDREIDTGDATNTPVDASANREPERAQPADHRECSRATASGAPFSRTPRRRYDDIGRVSQ
jgi:hypothetical protein